MHLNAEQAAWLVAVLTAVSSFMMNLLEAATDTGLLKTAEERSIAQEGR